LGLVLCKSGLCIVGLEALDLLKVRVLLYRAHLAVQYWCLRDSKCGFKWFENEVDIEKVVLGMLWFAVRRGPFVCDWIWTNIVPSARANRNVLSNIARRIPDTRSRVLQLERKAEFAYAVIEMMT
jgi:hypothetical protein